MTIGLFRQIGNESNDKFIRNPKKLLYLGLVIIFDEFESDGVDETVEMTQHNRIDLASLVVLKC